MRREAMISPSVRRLRVAAELTRLRNASLIAARRADARRELPGRH